MRPDLSPRRRLAVAALLALALVALAGCSAPRPPAVCAVCDQRIEHTAERAGVNVTVTRSELHLRLRPDGSARWVARVELSGPGVEDLRSDAALRERVVGQRLANDSGPAPDGHPNRSVSMSGATLVVAFDDPGLADRHWGVLVVDRFHHQDSELAAAPPFVQRADRIVLHAPDGWVVLNEPPRADTGADRLVWRRGIDDRTYVAVGPAGGTGGYVRGQLGVASEVAAWAVPPVLAGSVVPVLFLFGGLLVAFRGLADAPGRDPADGVDQELAASLTATGVGLLAALAVVVLYHRELWGVGGAVLAPLSGNGLLLLAAFVTLTLLPSTAAFAVAGVVADRRPAVRWPPAAAAVATAPLGLTMVVLESPGLGGLAVGGMVVWALLAVGAGLAAFALARRVARRQGWTREREEDAAPPSGPWRER